MPGVIINKFLNFFLIILDSCGEHTIPSQPDFLIITPGIRLPGDNLNDQARVMTPKDAFKNKVSGVVMGRSLTKGNIKYNVKKLIDHLNQ